MPTIFDKKYDGESLCDLSRDVSEAFDKNFNEMMEQVPRNEHGFHQGTFHVKIEWTPEE